MITGKSAPSLRCQKSLKLSEQLLQPMIFSSCFSYAINQEKEEDVKRKNRPLSIRKQEKPSRK